jgi:DNA repair protein RecO (recombination protein O)
MVQASWRARLSEHLGSATIDPGRAYAAEVLTDQVLLAGLSAMCALLKIVPERLAYPRLFDTVMVLLEALENRQVWLPLFVRFELALLEEVGFGLDLSACAATGTRDDLTHVSPRSGRAVSREAAEPYAERMFVLPAFLLSADAPADADDVLQGLSLTGHFLERRVYGADTSGLPAARERFVEILRTKGVPA